MKLWKWLESVILKIVVFTNLYILLTLWIIFSFKLFEFDGQSWMQAWFQVQEHKIKSVAARRVWRDPSRVSKKMWPWKCHVRTFVPMHWHPSHATNSAASPSCCYWNINNTPAPSFNANAANNTPLRLREGSWQIQNSPVNRFLSLAAGSKPTGIVGQLWLHNGTSSGVIVTQESSVMYGDHEGGEWAKSLLRCWRHHVTS